MTQQELLAEKVSHLIDSMAYGVGAGLIIGVVIIGWVIYSSRKERNRT